MPCYTPEPQSICLHDERYMLEKHINMLSKFLCHLAGFVEKEKYSDIDENVKTWLFNHFLDDILKNIKTEESSYLFTVVEKMILLLGKNETRKILEINGELDLWNRYIEERKCT